LCHVPQAEFPQQAGLSSAPGLPGTGASRLFASRAPASKARSHDIQHRQQPRGRIRGDEHADHDAEDREQPPTPAGSTGDEPEADVPGQRRGVPYREDDR